MADEIAENGHANGGDVPEIELIIKVSSSSTVAVCGACQPTINYTSEGLCIVPGRFSATRPWRCRPPAVGKIGLFATWVLNTLLRKWHLHTHNIKFVCHVIHVVAERTSLPHHHGWILISIYNCVVVSRTVNKKSVSSQRLHAAGCFSFSPAPCVVGWGARGTALLLLSLLAWLACKSREKKKWKKCDILTRSLFRFDCHKLLSYSFLSDLNLLLQ